jgi:hypothetical protein
MIAAVQGRRSTSARRGIQEEDALAKGQKKSNREIRKPKAAKAKPPVAASSALSPSSKKK